MNNVSIKTRLLLLVGALLALLVIDSASSVSRLRHSNAVLASIYNDRVVPLKQLKAIADAYAVNMVDSTHKTRDGIFTAAQGVKAIDDAHSVIETQWKAYVATELVAKEQELVRQVEPLMKQADVAGQRAQELMRKNDIEGLREFAAKQMYPTIDPVGALIEQLITVQLVEADREYKESQENYEAVFWRTIVLALLSVSVAGVMAWLLIGAISRGIARAVQVAETVAAGDLSSRIEVQGTDEIGQLLGALKRMNDSLVGIVGKVRHSADSIATGSAEIATGAADLSQRTEEQAANLEETAASMEQLTATVVQNTETARQATQLAASASTVAGQGGAIVGDVVNTMEAISASSKKIVDIIGVIDGIAFQTNILALNAAVEAARAGEQGRGFAVVASEVRSLAQRSAQAAKEIKTLIGDSVEKVDNGSRQVADAGKTMGDIVNQVKRVNDLIDEISHASTEQSSGIGQVGQAVNQLDQVTQQNAALVEQSAAAAESLKHQAAELARTVVAFKLPSPA
ncbi:methyl-accepting chemotaxis protein [Roseateles toxinivorans]|uniref:Methyl-accepting chemotaxis protein n=1 Tax=Roseateles toxinivorans TaxID=270368 RepID=A0A4R6QKU8_9BURK|nr:methyl-accepting chemotaxis protein [Roseateles toxinivorans]TDP63189.1 methyl-accepting chemotaxis protein [Roseateles toxinivorans]